METTKDAKYEGTWHKGAKEGYFKVTYENGHSCHVRFEQGMLIDKSGC